MHNRKCRIGEVGNLVRYGWHCVSQTRKGSRVPSECLPDANFSSLPRGNSLLDAKVGMQPLFSSQPNANSCLKYENLMKAHGISVLLGRPSRKVVPSQSQNELITLSRWHHNHLGSVRTLVSGSASETSGRKPEKRQKDITTVEDPFDAPTYNIPEKPVTFTEGASYSLVILAGLGIAGVAAYAVVTELILEPKEYKVFSKALERVQSDLQVRVRIGSPVKGYGQESRNRAARQRIPNRTWTDEDGVEHVEVNFHVRGPQGAGVVYTEMFKDKADKQWKYTYLMVEIRTPSPVQLLLESYVPS